MTHEPTVDTLHPHDPELAAAQSQWLESEVPRGRRLLDLGCGAGRTLVPLAARGVGCTGVDHDPVALADCRKALERADADAELIEAEFLQWLAGDGSQWDVVTCLGNTFCLVWDVEVAVTMLQQIRSRLAPGGMFILDDIPGDLWPEVSGGCWQEGIDESGTSQMIWAKDDPVLAVRGPSEVDPECWTFGPGDTRLRLWTASTLLLAAKLAGFMAPEIPAGAGVRVLRAVT